jgi:hypothetical protein
MWDVFNSRGFGSWFWYRLHIVACRPVAEQRPRDMKIYKSRCWVTASQTNIFPRKQLNYNEERCFLCGPYRVVISGTILELQSVSEENSRRLVWDGRQSGSYRVGAASQLWGIRQPVRMLAEDIVRICYQETTSEDVENFIYNVVTVIL